jgi:uncharacterized protein
MPAARLFDGALRTILRHPKISVALALSLAVAGGFAGSGVPIRLSLTDLLPEDTPLVRDFRAVGEEFGGIGYLGVVIGPIDGHPERYLADAAAELQRVGDIRYAFYEREGYLLDAKLLYLIPREEFDRLAADADTLLLEGRTSAIDLGLYSEEERTSRVRDAELSFEKLRAEHAEASKQNGARDRYFLSTDGRYAMLFAKPAFDSEDLGKGMDLIEHAGDAMRRALPSGIPFRLWGRYVNQVHDTLQIRHDIAVTSIVSTILIALVMVIGLGTARGAGIAAGCVAMSMGWTAGFVRLAIGQINIVTGFMLAILGGLGVEYGIHLIRRFFQERAGGLSREAALEFTYLRTGRALLSAALTSAGAFLILAFSDFRGFSELGLVAGVGVLSIYIVFLLAFPFLARFLPDRAKHRRAVEVFGWYPFSRRSALFIAPLIAVGVFGLLHAEFDLNFSRMRKLSDEANRLNSFVVELMGGRSTTPAALLARSPEEAAEVRDYLNRDSFKPTVDLAVSLRSIVPGDQDQRDARLEHIRRRIRHVSDEEIASKFGVDPARLRTWLEARPYGPAALPPHLVDNFGKRGSITVVYSDDDLDRLAGLRRFNGVLTRTKARFPDIKIGTDAVILAAIAEFVIGDGRIVLMLFLVGAFFVLWLDFRSLSDALVLEAQLISGIALLVGLMGAFGVPFTILNVGMIPAVLAAGIDMGVHVRHREIETGADPIESARFVAQAVQLGALTTVIGFGSLFLAQAEMLRGIAWVACLGQLSMYLISMFIYPVLRSVGGAVRHRSGVFGAPSRRAR